MEPKITINSKQGKIRVSLDKPKSTKQQMNPPVEIQPIRNEMKKTQERREAPIPWKSPSFQPPKRRGKKQRKSKQELFAILLSVLGAVVVGVIMGSSLLSIFFHNEPTYSKNSIDSHLLPKTKQKKDAVEAPFRVYLLQAGHFEHQSGAEEKMRTYRKQGLAAVLSTKSPYQIYLGVSLDQKGAKKLAADYQKKGVKVYIKELSIPSQPSNPERKSLAKMAQQSKKIFTELSRHSIDYLSTGSDQPIPLKPQINDEYQKILSSVQAMKQDLPEKDQESFMRMIQALDQAVQSAKEAKVHPSPALIWQIQEGLVRYITTYEQLNS